MLKIHRRILVVFYKKLGGGALTRFFVFLLALCQVGGVIGEHMAFGSHIFALLRTDYKGTGSSLHCIVLGTSQRTVASGTGID